MRKDTKKNFLYSFLIIIPSIILSIVAAEVILHVKNGSMQNYDIEMWRYAKLLKKISTNPKLGHEHIPNSSAILQSVKIDINEKGLRGGPIPPYNPYQRRILFLGSSITLGWGVKEEQTLTELIKKKFQDSGKDVVIFNAGIGNYNATRYIELFLSNLRDLKPTDIVIHSFVRDAEPIDSSKGNIFLRKSQLAVTLWIAINRLFGKTGEKSLLEHYQEIYAPNAQNLKEMKEAFKKLAAYAKDNNINIYFALTPDIHNLENYNLIFIHDIMKDIAHKNNFTFIDFLPYFHNLKPQDVWAMPGDPHPNALGHEIMADALYPVLSIEKNNSAQEKK